MTLPPRPHDPTEREVIAAVGDWQVRQFPESDSKLAYFTGRGFLHLQLWQPERAISLLTPSRLTGGRFDVWTDDGRMSLPTWDAVRVAIAEAPTPGPVEIEALERWFVLRHETPDIHLLRVWWASQPRARRPA